MFDIILAMTIHILVIDGAFDVGLTAILDTLSLANELIPTLGVKVEPLEVCLVGARRHVSTAHGLKVPCAAPSTLGRADAAVVPALGAKQPAQLIEALGSKDVRNAQGLLREYRQDNALIGAACTSTFVLAEGGGFLQDTGPRRHGGWRRISGSGTRMWASKNLECSSRHTRLSQRVPRWPMLIWR